MPVLIQPPNQVHYLRHGRIGDFVVKDAMVIGHESAGVVVEVGSEGREVAHASTTAVWHERRAARCGRSHVCFLRSQCQPLQAARTCFCHPA